MQKTPSGCWLCQPKSLLVLTPETSEVSMGAFYFRERDCEWHYGDCNAKDVVTVSKLGRLLLCDVRVVCYCDYGAYGYCCSIGVKHTCPNSGSMLVTLFDSYCDDLVIAVIWVQHTCSKSGCKLVTLFVTVMTV